MAPPIKPEGLFHGERLQRCSTLARLWFPYFFLASNNLGRLRLYYPDLLRTCFSGFAPPPTEAAAVALFEEYRAEFLLFIYRNPQNGEVWGQWDTDTSRMRFTTFDSQTSPAPPSTEFAAWCKRYQEQKAAAHPSLALFSSAPHGESPCGSEPHRAAPRDTEPHSAAPRNTEPLRAHVQRGEVLRGEGLKSKDGSEREASRNDLTDFSLPTNRNGQEWPVLSKHLDEWITAYPAVDVRQELREMRQWLLANSTRRKTARGMAAFINRWLGKEQDKGGARPAPASRRVSRTQDASELIAARRKAREQHAR